MTLIITITCDRAWVDPAIVDAIMDAGVGRIDAREGSVGRIDAGDARAISRIDAGIEGTLIKIFDMEVNYLNLLISTLNYEI